MDLKTVEEVILAATITHARQTASPLPQSWKSLFAEMRQAAGERGNAIRLRLPRARAVRV